MAYTVKYAQHVQNLVLIDYAAPNWNDIYLCSIKSFPIS